MGKVGEFVNGLLKFILYSAILYTVDFLSAEFHYEPRWLPALVALFLAVVGHFADRWVLPWTGDPLAVLLGGGFMVFTLWGAAHLFPGSEVTPEGALLAGVLLGITEYGLHRLMRGSSSSK
ncbi:MAG: hypothetical protein CW342_06065 [Thermoactinomycetaceae bacterium]|nr:hypothetical protein [Thermoactinomycetaceae bacterium]